mgnify:FL=1|jgi:hypothetical protein
MIRRTAKLNLTTGKVIRVLYFLKTLLMKKIDKPKKLMIIAKEKWTKENQSKGNRK